MLRPLLCTTLVTLAACGDDPAGERDGDTSLTETSGDTSVATDGEDAAPDSDASVETMADAVGETDDDTSADALAETDDTGAETEDEVEVGPIGCEAGAYRIGDGPCITCAAPPTDGLRAWLDGSDPDLTLDEGGGITSWPNRAGTPAALSGTGSLARRKTDSARFLRPVVTFPAGGGASFASAEPVFSTDRHTIIALVDYAGGIEVDTISTGTFAAGDVLLMRLNSRAVAHYWGADGGSAVTYGSTVTFENDTVSLIEQVNDGTTLSVYGDGVLGEAAAAPTLAGATRPLFIGARCAAAPCYADFEGDMAEVLVYERALSESERATVSTYLDERWLIPEAIAACHPLPAR